MAIFFTIVIVGLSAHLPTSVAQALAGAQVGPPDQGILTAIVSGNPTGALFGAFLGENPMMSLLAGAATVPGWQALSPTATAALLAPHFFATAIRPAFGSALSSAFLFAGGVTALSATISAFRGHRFVYGETHGTPSPAAATGGTIAPSAVARNRP